MILQEDVRFGNFKMERESMFSLEPYGALCIWPAWLQASSYFTANSSTVMVQSRGEESRDFCAQRIFCM